MNSSQSSSSSSTYRGTRGSRGRNHDSSSSIPSFHFNIHPYRRSRTTSQAAIIPHPLFKQTILTSPPPDLCLPSITNISPYIYVFGGSKPDITFTNDVYRMNAQNGIWEKLNTKGEKPRPRHRHTATYWKPNDHDSFLVIFGGNGEEYFNDVYLLNLQTLTWSQSIPHPSSTISPPPPRALHSTILIPPSTLLISFGVSGDVDEGPSSVLSTLVSYDLEKKEWSHLIDVHTPRYGHSTVWWRNRLYVVGGRNQWDECVPGLGSIDGIISVCNYNQEFSLGDIVDLQTPAIPTSSRSISSSTSTSSSSSSFSSSSSSPRSISMSEGGSTVIFTPQVKFYHHEELSGASPGKFTRQFMQVINEDELVIFGRFHPREGVNLPRYQLFNLHMPSLSWRVLQLPNSYDSTTISYFLYSAPSTYQFLGLPISTSSHPYVVHFESLITLDASGLGVYGSNTSLIEHEGQDSGIGGIAQDIASLYQDSFTFDFIITSKDGTEFKVHKLILMARWPHFKRLSGYNIKELNQNQLHLEESKEAVDVFLKWVYTDKIQCRNVKVLAEVLEIADMYCMMNLVQALSRELYSQLNLTTSPYIYACASIANLEGLKMAALKLILGNLGQAIRMKSFKEVFGSSLNPMIDSNLNRNKLNDDYLSHPSYQDQNDENDENNHDDDEDQKDDHDDMENNDLDEKSHLNNEITSLKKRKRSNKNVWNHRGKSCVWELFKWFPPTTVIDIGHAPHDMD